MMVESFFYEKETGCEQCPAIIVKRTILVDLNTKNNIPYMRGKRANREEIIEYKGLSARNGNYRVKRVGLVGSRSRIGQAAQSIVSFATPGNISPYRSPIRSGIARALTPGKPGGRIPGRGGGTSRCPEGYQFGGRFTDNRLSTCGAKLFDLPSPLGRAIGAIRRALRGPRGTTGEPVEGSPIRGTGAPGDVVRSRRPQIPRVAPKTNAAARDKSVSEVIKGMGEVDQSVARLVRRDGFVLEPVVSPGVLRTIPDNRDMEDATYVMRLTSVKDFGGDELGMLSNTGVTNLTYVLADGGIVEVKKVRPLTVGERRKLGRTVNKAIETDNSSDPAARAKFLVNETGDGMSYTEKLPKGKTIADMFKKGKAPKKSSGKAPKTPGAEKVTSVDEAAAIIKRGGPLSEISPSVLQQALSKANLFKREGRLYRSTSGKSYALRKSTDANDHLNHGIAAEIQKFLGVDTPDYGFTGSGARKSLLVESPESVVSGGKLTTGPSITDVDPKQMASLLVADLLSDIVDRKPNSIALVSKGDEVTAVPLFAESNLTDLSEIKVRERTQAQIRKFASVNGTGLYSKYYRELKDAQKRQMQQQIVELLDKARKFNFTQYRDRLYRDGQLTDGEKTHLEIVSTIIKNRVESLKNQREQILRALGGNK